MGADRAAFVGIEQVGRDVGTSVTGDGAQVHGGSGHQINGGLTFILTESGEIHRRTSQRTLTADQLARLKDRFIEPPGYWQAKSKLGESSRTVLLSGKPGSGRRSTALMLLYNSATPDAQFRELPVETDEEEKDSLDPESVQPGERLLLDMSAEERPEKFRSVQAKLESLRGAVVVNEGALVVVLPPDPDHLLLPEFSRLHVPIGRPSGKAVLDKCLKVDHVEFAEQDLDHENLKEHLADAALRDLDRLCQRILEAKHANSSGGFADWVERACEAFAKHGKQVAGQIRDSSAPQRAIVLAAAMLKDSHADSVQAAAKSLLTRLEYPEEEKHVLERDGLDDVLRSVKVVPNNSRKVAFDAISYENAVRNHFWANFPELRDSLRDWVGDCVGALDLADDDCDRLVVRFAEQARRAGRINDLCVLAEQWTKQADRQRRPPRSARWAAAALAHGLGQMSSPSAAGDIRKKIYEWAAQPSLTVHLAQVLVSVCAEVMAETHPDQAVVRLRLLASHNAQEVAGAATSAVSNLAQDNRFYRRFLWWMNSWLTQQSRTSDADLFLATSDPQRLLDTSSRSAALITNRTVQRQLVVGWRVVFMREVDGWLERVEEWLVASRAGEPGSLLLNVLVESTEGELAKLGALHVSSRDWAAAGPDGEERAVRQRTYRELARKIDAAQGLQLSDVKGTGRC
ncbi:hypothetical protein SAMN05216215_1004156 [Saccharopolyspora shandongensis]|uniref:Uncharacterized protein n=1 Tax=Saccharopolyspora shandongensis TaxID=418495 RepID=A0A1H2V1M7_9PSEU|nr:hypothetical protein [Saccharopolyspora shandongensis]SDW61859.1 hypothetical protein SAMN05216215_1004156 [Saccharopolyspora shandongensis]